MIQPTYSKNPISVTSQIDLLEEKGMTFDNKENAIFSLSTIGYYRFSGYAYCFRNQNDNSSFLNNTSFEKVHSIYEFDRSLRILLFDSIERIEIAFRTQMINTFTVATNDAFWYENPDFFSDKKKHATFMDKLTSELENCQEDFMYHFKKNYNNDYPPVWMAMQIVSFGGLVSLYGNINLENCKDSITRFFRCTNTDRFFSWVNTMVYLRNICGHHSRLWNRSIKKRPIAYHFEDKKLEFDNNTLYYTICIIKYLLDSIYPENKFKDDLAQLLNSNQFIAKTKQKYLGFRENWHMEKPWK